jgi:hypothetical protein
VMSFGIKYLCAAATKSPTNHEKNIANDHAHRPPDRQAAPFTGEPW